MRASVVRTVMVLPLVLPLVLAGSGPERAGVRIEAVQLASSATEDGLYCRYARGSHSGFYYEARGRTYVWVPVGEIHTARNVRGRFEYGTKLTATLAGGVSVNAGKTWTIAASSSSSRSFQVATTLPTVGGNQHKKVQAQFTYDKVRVVCVDRDPRSGQIVRRDPTPKYRYLPGTWTTNMRYANASTSVPKCRTGRSSVPENKVYLPRGQVKTFSWGKAYTSTVGLSAIGISGSFTVSDETSRSVRYWTSSGSTYVCGNTTVLSGATKLYANSR